MLSGQVQQWDLSNRNQKIENKTFETSVTQPSGANKFMSKRYSTPTFKTSESRYEGQRFGVEKMDLYKSKIYKTEELDLKLKDPVVYRDSEKIFSDGELDQLRSNTLFQSADKRSNILKDKDALDVNEILDRLSLSDINKYHFRRSRPTEPGFPVQEAGSEEVDLE